MKNQKTVKSTRKLKNKNNSKVLTLTKRSKIYTEFIKDLPKEALRVSELDDGTVLAIYGYQFVINRLNETIGFEHWTHKIINEPIRERKDKNWWVSLELELSLGNWINGVFIPLVSKTSYGSGVSESLGNALKGALTNAFKKAAAMYGIGKKAYEGLIEDYDIQEKAKEKAVNVKNSLTEKQLAVIKEFEITLMNVKNKKMLNAAKEMFEELKPKLDSKQIKYCEKLINRLEKKFND